MRLAGIQEALYPAEVRVMEALGHEGGERGSQGLLIGQAEHELRGAVEVHDPTRRVRGDDRLAGRLENRLEPLLLREVGPLSDHRDDPEGTGDWWRSPVGCESI